ncbi:VWA domain-containing protein [Bacillus halotolerans]|uniref:VWA domain-containing protein n=1 Tax=Bacillus halotolerans TaxID=260554 RepID=A0A9Q4HPE3_9BACI|nr:VWA domain-containing protein [Bacillus halotolerans]MCY9186625.1 VWA domain-containing protein [Bacillus halotolerans]
MGNLIDLTKKARIQLEKNQLTDVKAEIVFVIDTSYSMQHLYNNGTVQELVDRLLGIGMNMDANSSIDVFSFSDRAREVGKADEKNHTNYVKDNRIITNGGTKYAPVMRLILDKYGPAKKGFFNGLFESKSKKQEIPTFVFFITDGDNDDKSEAEKLIKEASKQPIFWQFVGIGNTSFNFLQQLDTMSGRFLDNANFFQVNDISAITDDELYRRLLNEFPDWLHQAKDKGILH